MKETGLIFKAPMVRAILEGRKTQIRRVAKPVKHPDFGNVYAPGALLREPQHVIDRACPLGQPGDRIYVRETWQVAGGNSGIWYAATDSKTDEGNSPVTNWRPSIHMPKDIARIWLEVAFTSVRLERLQDISEEDAIAEGIERADNFFGCTCWKAYGEPEGSDVVCPDDPIGSFRTFWESTGGDWDANPWVWAIDFKVLSTTGLPA